MSDELWKRIPGFTNYAAYAHPVTLDGTTGQILSIRSGRLLRARVSNRGYQLVNLTDDNVRQVTRTVHTLVLFAWARERPEHGVARHLNDDPLDNRWPENLVWGTQGDNERDKYANGHPKPVPPGMLCLDGSRKECWLRRVTVAEGITPEKAARLASLWDILGQLGTLCGDGE